MMQTFVRPSRDLRNHYAEIADMTKNHNHVIITNQGRGESVLINIDVYKRQIRAYHKTLPPDTMQYIGIAADEPKRLTRLNGNKTSLLDKYHMTEAEARTMCEAEGLLSPLYEFSRRGGCWFCPNASVSELRHLYYHHPDLWKRLLELQDVPNKTKMCIRDRLDGADYAVVPIMAQVEYPADGSSTDIILPDGVTVLDFYGAPAADADTLLHISYYETSAAVMGLYVHCLLYTSQGTGGGQSAD